MSLDDLWKRPVSGHDVKLLVAKIVTMLGPVASALGTDLAAKDVGFLENDTLEALLAALQQWQRMRTALEALSYHVGLGGSQPADDFERGQVYIEDAVRPVLAYAGMIEDDQCFIWPDPPEPVE